MDYEELFMEEIRKAISPRKFNNEKEAVDIGKKIGNVLKAWMIPRKRERKILDKKFYDSQIRRQLKSPNKYFGSTEHYHAYKHDNNSFFYTWREDIRIRKIKELKNNNSELFEQIYKSPPKGKFIDTEEWHLISRRVKKLSHVEFNKVGDPVKTHQKIDLGYKLTMDPKNTLIDYQVARLIKTLCSAIDCHIGRFETPKDNNSWLIMGNKYVGFILKQGVKVPPEDA